MQKFFQSIKIPLLLSLTLGLAPFTPEPHIIGKIRWIAGGAVGMQGMDWFDVVFHGFTWVWLFIALIVYFVKLFTQKKASSGI